MPTDTKPATRTTRRGPNRRRSVPSASAPSGQLARQLRSAINTDPHAPGLDDPACAGRWELFDDRAEGEDYVDYTRRWDVARSLCRECPDLPACAAWEAAGAAVPGVLAGRAPGERATKTR